MTQVMPGAEPFLYQGGDIGCLLLHGFTGTPQEMRRLGQFLHGCGYTVHGPLLAGHGTSVQQLSTTTWRDWFQSALDGWQALDKECAHVFTIGLSVGGALALHLAAHVQNSGVVAMATPLVVDSKLLWLARLASYVVPYRKKGPSDIKDRAALGERVAYRHTPTHSTYQLLLFFQHLRDDLPEVHVPVLLIHSRRDTTVDPRTMPRLYKPLGAGDKRMLWLENSGHIVTEDRERDLVYVSIRDWIKERT